MALPDDDVVSDQILQSLTNRIASQMEDTRDTLRILHMTNRNNIEYAEAEPAITDFEQNGLVHILAELYDYIDKPVTLDDTLLRDATNALERTHACTNMRARILDLVDVYTKKYKELCFTHMHCKYTLRSFRALTEGLRDVPYVGIGTDAFVAVQTSMSDYVRHVYKDVLDVQGAFNAFHTCYAEWLSLRNALLGLHPFARGSPQCAATCTICTVEPVQYVYVPCGHTFCRSCTQKQTGLCFVCRTPIETTQQLFFL